MTKQQAAVLATPEAMKIILTEAKELLAKKAAVDVAVIEAALLLKQPKVVGMMHELVCLAINSIAATLTKEEKCLTI